MSLATKFNDIISKDIISEVPEDIINEIFNHIPYHIKRSLNNKYKKLFDNYELKYNCHQPITINNFTFNHIIKYINKNLKIFAISDIKNNKFIIFNKSVKDHYLLSYLYDNNDQIILNPIFYLFLLLNHPLNKPHFHNENFIRSKLLATIIYNLKYLSKSNRNLYGKYLIICQQDLKSKVSFIKKFFKRNIFNAIMTINLLDNRSLYSYDNFINNGSLREYYFRDLFYFVIFSQIIFHYIFYYFI